MAVRKLVEEVEQARSTAWVELAGMVDWQGPVQLLVRQLLEESLVRVEVAQEGLLEAMPQVVMGRTATCSSCGCPDEYN